MVKSLRILGLAVAILGIVGVVIGIVFVVEGFAKNNLIVERMNIEQVSLALDPNNPTVYTQINNAAEAQQAADIIASHRRQIAPTYQDLLAGGQFDPTNPQHLAYAQAMNLENYLYMAVTAFGLIQVTMASGAFMIITGLAVGGVGFALYRIGRVQAV
jgi:hypothetical protein